MVKRTAWRVMAWYRGLSRDRRIGLSALAMLIILGAGYIGIRDVALRTADHVEVTVTGPDGQVIFRQTFGQPFTSKAEHLLNDETHPQSENGTSLPSPSASQHYHLAFTWEGILVETADVTTDVWPELWFISALGIPDLQTHEPNGNDTYSGSIIRQLYVASSGVIP